MLEAERLGYDSVWTAEAYGSDAATILAWLAQATSTIKLGSAIFQMPGRSRGDDGDDRGDDRPALRRADAARDRLQRAAGGRGLARAALRPPAAAHARVRRGRADGAARASASRSTARRSSCRCRTGPGKALKLTIAPVQERIPIYIAAIGPKNTTLAAEIADGWLPTLFSPEHVGEFRPLLEEGFARAGGGKGFDDFDIVPTRQRDGHRRPRVRARRDAPLRRALRRRDGLAQAELLQRARAAATGSRTPRARSRTSTWRASKDEAAAALPGELIDTVALVGPRRRRARAARASTATPASAR